MADRALVVLQPPYYLTSIRFRGAHIPPCEVGLQGGPPPANRWDPHSQRSPRPHVSGNENDSSHQIRRQPTPFCVKKYCGIRAGSVEIRSLHIWMQDVEAYGASKRVLQVLDYALVTTLS